MKIQHAPFIALVFGLLVMFASACTYPIESLLPTTDTVPPPTITSTALPTDTRTPRPPTDTPLPPTVTPTASPSPTSTPLPDSNRTLPRTSPLISAQNLTQLGLYAQLPAGVDGLSLGELAYSPSNELLAFATDAGVLVVWDIATYDPLYTFETAEIEQGVAYPDVAFAPPAGQYLGANGNAFLDQYDEYWGVALQWSLPITETEDLGVGTVISPTILAGTSHWAKTGVTYTPDGARLVVGTREGMGGGGSVKVWSAETGESLLDIVTLDWITDVVVSPDGSTILGTTYGQVLVWDAVSGNEKSAFSIVEGPLWGLALSPNGRLLAVWGDSTVYLVDQFSGSVVYQLEGESEVLSAVFTPNGRMLISADGDTIRFWDVASYQSLSTLQMPEPIVALAISADGRSLAIGTTEGVVYLWGILTN